MKQFYRHGDLLITRIDSLPEGKKEETGSVFVLAHGETGHKHVLTVERPETLTVVTTNGATFFSVAAPTPLTHEEHKAIVLPMGTYALTFEVEYDPFSKKMQQVID